MSLTLSLGIVFMVAVACYTNTFQAQFVYDDIRAILKNKDLLPSRPWSNLLHNDFWGTPIRHSGSHKSYRPLCVASFRVNYMIRALDPRGYHIVNTVLHAIVSTLFAYFCHMVYGNAQLTLIGGLLFAVHPIHTEAVAGVVGRADVGAALFFLLALISYVKSTSNHSTTNWAWLSVCLLCSLCAVLTKEQGVTVLGVCVVYELLLVSGCNVMSAKQAIRKLIASGGLVRSAVITGWLSALLYGRFLIMGHATPDFSPADNPAANNPYFLTRLMTFLYLPFFNLCLLVYPWQLSFDWSMDAIPLVKNMLTLQNLCSLSLYCAILYITVIYVKYCWQEKSDDDETKTDKNFLDLMVFELAVMILPYLPATNLFFYVGFVVAERILYLPSIGFCLLVVNGLQVKTNTKYRYGVFAIICMFALKTYDRNFAWQTEESLYSSGTKVNPPKAYANLANIYGKENRYKEAEHAYKSALTFRPNMADTHYNFGIFLQNQNRFDEAIESYKKAIFHRPRLAAAHLNLGVTLMTTQRLTEALQVLRDASNINDHGLKDPHNHAISLTHIRYNCGRVLFDLNRLKESLIEFHTALKIMPEDYEPHSILNMIGQAHTSLNNLREAEKWYLKALKSKSDHAPALLTYAKHLASLKKYEEAESYFERTLEIETDRQETYWIYANMLVEQGRHDKAVFLLEKALKLDPNNFTAYRILSSVYRNKEDYQKALHYQLKAKEINPKEATVLMNLGALYHLVGDLQKAGDTYTEALKYAPNDPTLNDNIRRLKSAMSKK